MNVLFVTYDFPYPTTSGGKNRAFHLLKYTAKKANIFLYSFVREDYNPDSNDEILKLGVKKIIVTKRKKLSSPSNFSKTIFQNSSIFKTLYYEKSILKQLIETIKQEKIDLVHFESSYTGFYIGEQLRKLGVKQVLGTENIEFRLYLDYAKSLKKMYLKPFVHYQANRLKKEELDMVVGADRVTTITQNEADVLKNLTGKTCSIVANGIEPEVFSYKFKNTLQSNLLFVGNFTYFPNIDAINFFCKNVFEKLPTSFTLTVVGKKCNEKVKFNNRRIIKKDFVEDIALEYRNADALIFPIRIGGGTNFKVLEAMSLGVPIVARPERLAGLEASEGKHFLGARSADEYVSQINKLYKDSSLRKNLSQNARELIEKSYAWKMIGENLFTVWKETL